MQKNNENREIVQIKRFNTKKAIKEEPVLTKQVKYVWGISAHHPTQPSLIYLTGLD